MSRTTRDDSQNLASRIPCKSQHNNRYPHHATCSSHLDLGSHHHMFVIQSANPRKRQSRDWETTQAQELGHNNHKRRKRTVFPPAFWDNLSQIHLTEQALRELNRRNTLARSRQAAGRRSLRLDKNIDVTIPVDRYLQSCNASIINELRRSSRHGGLDMSEARGRSTPSRNTSRARSSQPTARRHLKQNPTPTSSDHCSAVTSSTRSGPYNRDFQQHLIDNNVFPDEYEYPDGRVPEKPSNWEQVKERLSRRRASLSPSQFTDDDFRQFKRLNAHALKEKQVATSVFPIIEGSVKNTKCTSGGIPFRNLDPLTDGTVTPGNPDVYYGARPEQLHRQIREELKNLIEPSTQDDSPICPNLFVAIKGPDGTSAVAQRQCLYDGALGARAIHSLQNYRQTQQINDKASTITVSYQAGQLTIYTVHRSGSTDDYDRPNYYMHQINAWSMSGNADTFRHGATHFRNARDWAEEERNEAIYNANQAILAPPHVNADPSTPTLSIGIEGSIFERSSPESARYLTPPTGEQIRDDDLQARLSDSVGYSLDTAKRVRQQKQSLSPAQPKKRHRARHRPSSSPETIVGEARESTGLSFGLEGHSLSSQERIDSEGGTEVLSSDEEQITG